MDNLKQKNQYFFIKKKQVLCILLKTKTLISKKSWASLKKANLGPFKIDPNPKIPIKLIKLPLSNASDSFDLAESFLLWISYELSSSLAGSGSATESRFVAGLSLFDFLSCGLAKRVIVVVVSSLGCIAIVGETGIIGVEVWVELLLFRFFL